MKETKEEKREGGREKGKNEVEQRQGIKGKDRELNHFLLTRET